MTLFLLLSNGMQAIQVSQYGLHSNNVNYDYYQDDEEDEEEGEHNNNADDANRD